MSKTSKDEALTEALRQARDATSQLGDAARKIWLAGLGAFAKANAGSGELFGKLMKQGVEFEATARRNAGERMKETREQLEETVERASRQGKETWIKVEKAVSEQLKKSLDKLGVPGPDDLDAIHSRLDQIAEGVSKAASRSTKAAPVKSAAKAGDKKSAKPAAGKPAAAASGRSRTSAGKSAASAPRKDSAAAGATRKSTAKPVAATRNQSTAVKKASASIAAKRASLKSSLAKAPRVPRKRDEIADIAAELETAQLAARKAARGATKKK